MPKKKVGLWLLTGVFMIAAGVLYSCDRKEPEVILTQQNMQDEEPEARETIPEPETLFVHVCGAVVRAGVYELPEGSRCLDAVEAAGGFSEDADRAYVNLAAFVTDGQKLQIPTVIEAESLRQADMEAASGMVNINTADAETLMTLSGIGEARAETIISYREEHGPFESVEDIMNVPGIKDSAYNKIKEHITV